MREIPTQCRHCEPKDFILGTAIQGVLHKARLPRPYGLAMTRCEVCND